MTHRVFPIAWGLAASAALSIALAAAGTAQGTSASPARADLVVTSIVEPPTISGPQFEFSSESTIVNAGSAKAGATTTAWYLTPAADVKQAVPGASSRLAGRTRIAGLRPGSSSHKAVRIAVPAGTPTGYYALTACADAGRRVRERSESNNCHTSAIDVYVTSNLPTPPPH